MLWARTVRVGVSVLPCHCESQGRLALVGKETFRNKGFRLSLGAQRFP